MTVVAGVAAGNVTLILAGRYDAVVTRAAAPEYLGVVNGSHGHECRRCMAVLADVGRTYVCRTLARCVSAVVARAAAADDLRVVYRRHRREY